MKDYLYAIITGRTTGIIPTLLLGLLIPLSYLYAVVVKTRGWLYDCGLLRQKQLPCAVISVGNIVAWRYRQNASGHLDSKISAERRVSGGGNLARLQARRSSFGLGRIRRKARFDTCNREWR